MKSRKMRSGMAEHWNKDNAKTSIKAAAPFITKQERTTLQGYLKKDELDKVYKGIATMLHKHLDIKPGKEKAA